MQLEVGNIVEGKITGITNFGAFVRLNEKQTGLIHISEVSSEYVENIRDHLKEEQIVKVKVLSIDPTGKISLSIKKAIVNPTRPIIKKRPPADVDWSSARQAPSLSFEDKMNKFKQDSDERMQDIKRNIESKRGGGFKRPTN
ncbi:MAG: S1 RNA-binding domain-containing protein [Hyphomonadaceae bacterium]|nr:S1 RNA-binding domain-containing protein [Clostridia bacterium]